MSLVQKIIDGLHALPERYHTICLHGGEPTLIGKSWFERFAALVTQFNQSSDDKRISIAIQTNGIEIDEDWIQLFKLASVGISISIDGPQLIHDSARVDRKGRGTFERVKSCIQRLNDARLDPSAIAVLTKESMMLEPAQFYSFFADLPTKEIDIAPYVETGTSDTEKIARSQFEADVRSLTTYMNQLFDVWFYDSRPSQYVNIRCFEQTVGALLGYTPTLCNRQGGFACGRTPCVMPDGTVFACDLETERIDLRLGNLHSEKFEEIVQPERLIPLHKHIAEAFETLGCYSCGLLGLCAFACPRFAFSGNHFKSYCDFTKDFVSHVKTRLNGYSMAVSHQKLDFDYT